MADTEKISIVIDAQDNASGTINNVGSNLRNMYSSINGLNSALRHYNSTMSTFNHMMINSVKEIGSAIYDFTSDSINSFSELSEQHAKTLGAMANDYDKTLESQQKFIENSEKLRQQAIDLAKYGINGQGSLATPVDVSSVQTELVKAGISADTMLSTDVVKDVLQFAQANQLKTDQAVEFAVSLGSQFGVAPENWGDMLDKVSHTADLSVIDVADIVQSMKYAGGISAGLDRPIEETLGMISVLGNFGLKGSQAGSGIQALLTRLLTGDTTVITQAQAEVAPENALKAFYDFSNYAKSAGSEITYDDILNETFTESDITGSLRPMEDVMDALETTMESLNDEEQAWFAKKLFGLYQMKSAYALINGDDSGEMALNEVITEIETNSGGTNENKLAELINSQSGQMAVTQNLIEGIKTELGMMLEPTVVATLHEIQGFLKDPGNYEINWDSIRTALDESCDAIEEAYGSAIADSVRNLGGLTIDLGQIVEEIGPEFMTGMLDVFNNILSGNFGKDGVGDSWDTMITNMNASLEDLPPNLQELGEKVVDVIDMFGKLATLNIATTIAQLVTSVMQIAMMTINAASVIVNGSTITGKGAGTGIGTGTGTSKGGSNTANTAAGASVVGKNLAGVGGAVVGGIAGDKIGDAASDVTSGIAKDMGASDDTANIVGGVTDTAVTVGGVMVGGKIGRSLFSAGSKFAPKVGTAAGSLLSTLASSPYALPIAGIAAIAGSGAMLYNNYQNDKDLENNRTQTARITESGGKIGFDNDGNIIKDSKGNVRDFSSVEATQPDAYKYNAGQPTFLPTMPEKSWRNFWGRTSGYKLQMEKYQSAYGEYEADRDKFYTVQGNYEASTGKKLDWFSYKSNKSEYDSKYAEATTALTDSIDTLNQTIGGMANQSVETKDLTKTIPGFNAFSEKGKQEAIQAHLDNQIQITPQFTMEAPHIQVDVTVDSNGRVTSQQQSILNPGFNNTINNWYQRISSQNGATPK